MTYQRTLTPRIYVDNINFLLSAGKMATSDITLSGETMVAGSSLIEIFDLRPTNTQTISTGVGDTTANFYIEIDTNYSTDANVDNNFIAILGHNMDEADAEFRIQTDDHSGFASAQSPAMVEVVNCGGGCDAGSGNYCSPAYNGWSLATFSQATDNRYMRIYFDPADDSNYDANLGISAIIVGEYWDFPNSPDLNISKTFEFDGVKKLQSFGGQTYSNASYLRGGHWNVRPPYKNSTSTSAVGYGYGRTNMDMSFSYLADTDVFPDLRYDTAQVFQSNNMLNNLIVKTGGGHFPFLLQYDNATASADDSFLWCRLDNEPEFSQIAYQTWDTSLSFREEF
tara:strand:+ start:325 stop:1341 length:1017 start_codon:yes stop_codon:yes gene_type:complete